MGGPGSGRKSEGGGEKLFGKRKGRRYVDPRLAEQKKANALQDKAVNEARKNPWGKETKRPSSPRVR